MISEALIFLKGHVQSYLEAKSGTHQNAGADPAKVVFIGTDVDPINFATGAVSILLINLEEEKTMRAADLHIKPAPTPDGTAQRIQADIRLNLYVLFVARFAKYEDSLSYLSLIIRHFQNYRVFDHRNAPELSDEIEQLVMELITLPLSEQNDLWSALRTTYQPSVLYKVKMIVIRDEEPVAIPPVKEYELKISS